jgi:myo-inositol-1-phosphate synthase
MPSTAPSPALYPASPRRAIRVAIAGIGNCAGSLVEGVWFYHQNPHYHAGLLFPTLAGYRVSDIEFVAGFDISELKADKPLSEAIFAAPNNFIRIPGVRVQSDARIFRAPTLDGNPAHLAHFVPESSSAAEGIAAVLRQTRAEVLLNLLPTGSIEASQYYAGAALEAGCAFINCIPSVLAQHARLCAEFERKGLPIIGDDIKSQVGTTILHRALLHMLEARGAELKSTSQINVGGNTDFANFVHRAETKLVSKRKSLSRYTELAACHIGHHYDPNRGPFKHAFIDLEAEVFGRSTVKIAVRLESDDKPNSAGSIVDLIRIAKGAMDRGLGGVILEACAYYCKSPPMPVDDGIAFELVRKNWAGAELNPRDGPSFNGDE